MKMKNDLSAREKRIVRLLSQYGALSKKDLAERDGMSWGTAVKQIARLEKAGMIQSVGCDPQPTTTGKNPLLYALADRYPLAIGLEVTQSTTHIVLTNLKKEIMQQASLPTPKHPTLSQLQEFLIAACLEFAQQHLGEEDILEGIGVSLPLSLLQGDHAKISLLRSALGASLHTEVQIEHSACSYALYLKWAGSAVSLENFFLLTVRSEIGAGIFYHGDVFRGAHGMAGDLGHLVFNRHGDFAAFANEEALYRDYCERILGEKPCTEASVRETDMRCGLLELFSLAKHGHQVAHDILKRHACSFGTGIAGLLKMLDIPHIILAAYFGPSGDVLLPYITAEVNARLSPGREFSIDYAQLEPFGFAQGAALSILENYFTVENP